MISAAPLKLASGGKAFFKIAVAEKPGKFDGFAAEDLIAPSRWTTFSSGLTTISRAPNSGSFWTQGASHANIEHLYVLTDGNEADNTWDEGWFRAKFTGPAYVPTSTKKNGIYIDLVVFVRK